MEDFELFKRTVLIVEDEAVNREILGCMLENDYEVLYASDGAEAMRVIGDYGTGLSVILLDLLMPNMNGYEVLEALRDDPMLKRIPVIVLTAERSAEVKSLGLGAVDFIPKPYDSPEIIQARVRRIIQMAEDSATLKSIETDDLTGLYSGRFFFKHADRIERYDPAHPMDAVVLNIDSFHLINDLRGRACGDEVLKSLADHISAEMGAHMGVACRENADSFYLYVDHMDDAEAFLDRVASGVRKSEGVKSLRLRMGIYPEVDHGVPMETRFARARHACNSIRNNFARRIAVYDAEMHRREVYEQRLVDDFDVALAQGQFKVWFQPKYDIRGGKPVLASAEALVRWAHPEFGMISPGDFIPLFEANSLIARLDRLVWFTAAAHIRQWRDQRGVSLPVSVNVSRINARDPLLTEDLIAICQNNGIQSESLVLEITESAYSDSLGAITEVVQGLRAHGFRVEMDDFGSGYSSLNMLTTLPMDALKLDMSLVRDIARSEKDLHVLKLIVGIAKFLKLPLVAEGVETKEQFDLLKNMGCDYIQGYYFSKPVPPEEFSNFLDKGKE